MRDRQHRAGEHGGVLLRLLLLLPRRSLGSLDAMLRLGDRARRRRLGELAGDEVVAKVARRDVDHVAALAERLDGLEQDGLCHGLALGDVGEEPELTRALDRSRELRLMPAACARDASRADLALLAHVPPERAELLVVHVLDLVAAERARLSPPTRRGASPVSPARRPATTLLSQLSRTSAP